VINRGNYRSDVSGTEGAKAALLRGLGETAEKLGWRVHAWVIMSESLPCGVGDSGRRFGGRNEAWAGSVWHALQLNAG
jgi:hypothetical protein